VNLSMHAKLERCKKSLALLAISLFPLARMRPTDASSQHNDTYRPAPLGPGPFLFLAKRKVHSG
jgi:hypothetical protein